MDLIEALQSHDVELVCLGSSTPTFLQALILKPAESYEEFSKGPINKAWAFEIWVLEIPVVSLRMS